MHTSRQQNHVFKHRRSENKTRIVSPNFLEEGVMFRPSQTAPKHKDNRNRVTRNNTKNIRKTTAKNLKEKRTKIINQMIATTQTKNAT